VRPPSVVPGFRQKTLPAAPSRLLWRQSTRDPDAIVIATTH
jgi:hypothetical protein